MPIDPSELDNLIANDPIDPAKSDEWPPLCPKCGYNLTGLPETRCPECGSSFTRRGLRIQHSILRIQLRNLQQSRDWPITGAKFAGVGLVALVISMATHSTAPGLVVSPLTRIAAFVLALIGAGLGLTLRRALSLPSWLRGRPEFSERLSYGIAAILVGLGVAVACILAI